MNQRHEGTGPTPSDTALVEQLLDALPNWFAVTGRLSELVADDIGVNPTDLQCLHFLNQHGPASAGELARRVGRSTGAVTRMIDRLERAGFVARHRGDQDRRSVVVHATTDGIDRIRRRFDDLAAQTREDLAHHSPAELAVLLRFVRASTDSTTTQLTAFAERSTTRGA